MKGKVKEKVREWLDNGAIVMEVCVTNLPVRMRNPRGKQEGQRQQFSVSDGSEKVSSDGTIRGTPLSRPAVESCRCFIQSPTPFVNMSCSLNPSSKRGRILA